MVKRPAAWVLGNVGAARGEIGGGADDVVVEATLPNAGAGGAAEAIDLGGGVSFDGADEMWKGGRVDTRPYTVTGGLRFKSEEDVDVVGHDDAGEQVDPWVAGAGVTPGAGDETAGGAEAQMAVADSREEGLAISSTESDEIDSRSCVVKAREAGRSARCEGGREGVGGGHARSVARRAGGGIIKNAAG